MSLLRIAFQDNGGVVWGNMQVIDTQMKKFVGIYRCKNFLCMIKKSFPFHNHLHNPHYSYTKIHSRGKYGMLIKNCQNMLLGTFQWLINNTGDAATKTNISNFCSNWHLNITGHKWHFTQLGKNYLLSIILKTVYRKMLKCLYLKMYICLHLKMFKGKFK